jgi:pimeloyl-ACP methyl ester carboxylesterase
LVFTVWRAISSQAHGGQYVNINGVRIWYETYGSGTPVLVLHGGTGSLEDMHKQIRALAATRFVVAVDSRGHGRSTDSDAPLSYALMANDMLKLLDQMNIRQTDIVGWSDGGIIGLDLAMHHPERVARLVAIGANYDVDGLQEKPDLNGPERTHPACAWFLCPQCAESGALAGAVPEGRHDVGNPTTLHNRRSRQDQSTGAGHCG